MVVVVDVLLELLVGERDAEREVAHLDLRQGQPWVLVARVVRRRLRKRAEKAQRHDAVGAHLNRLEHRLVGAWQSDRNDRRARELAGEP